MIRRNLTFVLLGAALTTSASAAASEAEAASGIRAALERGALAAVAQLGVSDGFLGNPKVHIALPRHLEEAARWLRKIGQGRQIDELVTAMNRAAEAAMPEARALFVSTVKAITVSDAWQVVRGGPTSVTDFFAARTRLPLGERFLPIVTRSTEKLQLAKRYDALAGKAAGLGLIKGDEVSLEKHVTAKALDGLFFMVAEEEKKIRANPMQTGSAILKKVFGG